MLIIANYQELEFFWIILSSDSYKKTVYSIEFLLYKHISLYSLAYFIAFIELEYPKRRACSNFPRSVLVAAMK